MELHLQADRVDGQQLAYQYRRIPFCYLRIHCTLGKCVDVTLQPLHNEDMSDLILYNLTVMAKTQEWVRIDTACLVLYLSRLALTIIFKKYNPHPLQQITVMQVLGLMAADHPISSLFFQEDTSTTTVYINNWREVHSTALITLE